MSDTAPRLILMCGISGSGKTTLARDASTHLPDGHSGYLYLCPDDFYKVFHGDERIHTNEFEVWMSLWQALHTAEMNGRNVILDTNAPTIVDRVQFLNWFPGFETTVVCVLASPEICRYRNAHRSRVVPPEEMDRMIRRFQLPFPEEDERYRGVLYYRSAPDKKFIQTDASYAREWQKLYQRKEV